MSWKKIVLVLAVAVRSETFCVPDALVGSGQYYAK